METNNRLTIRYLNALEYAFKKQGWMVRDVSGVSFFSHLLAVSGMVLDYGYDEEVSIGGLFYSCAQDTATLTEINSMFGARVSKIIEDCSGVSLPQDIAQAPWKTRQEAHIAQVPSYREDSIAVLAAKQIHNIRTIMLDYKLHGMAIFDSFPGGLEGTMWYLEAMTTVLANTKRCYITTDAQRELVYLKQLVNGR